MLLQTNMDVQSQQPLELTAFVQLCLAGKVLREYEIRSPVISIGRSPDCDITIDNAAVSSFHAMVSQREGKLFVEDAASTNGVLFDDVKTTTVELKLGESVDIAGKYSLRLIDAPVGIPIEISSQKSLPEDVQKETVLVDTATLRKMSQSVRPAYLTLSLTNKPTWICRLDKPCISIGRKRSCEIRVGGWLSPALIATIERREDGYYLQVEPGCDVSVDGQSVAGEYRRLQEGDRLRFRKLGGVFHERNSARSG